MRLTQGQFSFLPDLTDEQIEAQITYALSNGWSIMVEFTDDPHPRNGLWEMWSPPMFDLTEDEVDVAMRDVRACREAHSNIYVKVVAYDRSLGRQTTALSSCTKKPIDMIFTPWDSSGRILRSGETGGRSPPRPNMRGIE